MGTIAQYEDIIVVYEKRIQVLKAEIKENQEYFRVLKKYNSTEGIKRCEEIIEISENHINALQNAINEFQNIIDIDAGAK